MRTTLHRIRVSAALAGRELARNRVAVVMFFVLPTVFYLLIYATTGERPIQFQLSALGERVLQGNERHLSILFMGMAAISGISAFLAFILVLRATTVDRRLVFEGFRPAELLGAKLIVITTAALLVATYVTALLPAFFRPISASGVFCGFLLNALVYGVLGMAVGAVSHRELEGILFILLLVNVDAGWLQNPVFYAHAYNQRIIRILPGHHPGQVAMLSAFAEGAISTEAARSLVYAAAIAAAAAALYWLRVRVAR